MKTFIVAALLGLSLTAAHVAPAAAGDFAVEFYKQLSERGN